MFRFNTNRWYTIELRYKLSSAPRAKDGVVEVWIDGTKIYSASDLSTCGVGIPQDYSGLGAIFIGTYHNAADLTVWDGQQIIDNLIVSKAYIGPPGSSGLPTPTPTMINTPGPSTATPMTTPSPATPSPRLQRQPGRQRLYPLRRQPAASPSSCP